MKSARSSSTRGVMFETDGEYYTKSTIRKVQAQAVGGVGAG